MDRPVLRTQRHAQKRERMPFRSAPPPGRRALRPAVRCGTPPATSAGSGQPCRDPRPARCQTASKISAPGSPLALPRRDGLPHGAPGGRRPWGRDAATGRRVGRRQTGRVRRPSPADRRAATRPAPRSVVRGIPAGQNDGTSISSLAPRENRAPLPPLLSLRLEGQGGAN